ncbi:MAG: NAD(P)H-binding protein [Pseudomonadota bacterium]
MTLAVTAVSGQLGKAIATTLLARRPGQTLVGLARKPETARIDGLDMRPGDYTNHAQMTASLAGVDTLLLVSLNTAPDIRTEQHRTAIQAAKDAGVRRVVYTSVQGAETGTAFSPVIQSNRQTEADLVAAGFATTVGRNGIYIEPDIDYIETYAKDGEIANSAGDGLCGYTTRSELAAAYANLLLEEKHIGQTYHLHGPLMSQAALAQHLNRAFGTHLTYRAMSVEAYREDRKAALGAMMGTIIAGIYEGFRTGVFDRPSDFEKAAGRPHQSWDDYFASLGPAAAGTQPGGA